jgi:hypothetical protein
MPGNRSKSRRRVDRDDGSTATNDGTHAPLFQPFRWTDPKTDHLQIEARSLNQLIEKVIDVTDGVRAVMCVLERDGYSREDDAPPLLDPVRQGALRRLGIASMQLLSDEATRLSDWVLVHHEREGIPARRSSRQKRSKHD